MALVTRHLNVASTTKTDTGGDQGDITLLGVEWRTYLGDHWYVKLETEGAAGGASVDNLGLQIDYFINPDWYITGQGLAAYKGDAGAFMTGLVGTGVRKNLNKSLYLNAETLAGAAGGGGLAMGSGLVWQGNAGVGYDINPYHFLHSQLLVEWKPLMEPLKPTS